MMEESLLYGQGSHDHGIPGNGLDGPVTMVTVPRISAHEGFVSTEVTVHPHCPHSLSPVSQTNAFVLTYIIHYYLESIHFLDSSDMKHSLYPIIS